MEACNSKAVIWRFYERNSFKGSKIKDQIGYLYLSPCTRHCTSLCLIFFTACMEIVRTIRPQVFVNLHLSCDSFAELNFTIYFFPAPLLVSASGLYIYLKK